MSRDTLLMCTLILALLSLGVQPAAAQVPPIEREALLALYNTTAGPQWTDNSGWTSEPGSECTWFGVACDIPDHVTSIALPENNLAGVLPGEIADLTELRYLDLDGNALEGPIPSGLGGLELLEFLQLSRNSLSGAIPAELGGLVNLLWLNLWGNQLEGPIPAAFGQMVELRYLNLSGNQLSGEIPPELENVVNLEILALDLNQLTGPIPETLGALANLQELWLGSNQLTGSLPAFLGSMSDLRVVGAWSNQLVGAIPSELGSAASLELLYLGGNQLSGEIPPELGSVTTLLEVDLSWNMLQGTIPPQLANATLLITLNLEGNLLSGTIPTQLGTLTDLTFLSLAANQLNGTIPSQLGDLDNLEALLLYWNSLSGEIPPDLGDLSSLWVLFLDANQLTGSIPAELGNLNLLSHLGMTWNELSGEIPAELGNLANLQGLYLHGNDLTGAIPPRLGDLANLVEFGASGNQLSGGIPAELGGLSNLAGLWLAANLLEGSVPSELGNLSSLIELDLRSNTLLGDLPTELGNLVNLADGGGLDLRWNGLWASNDTLRDFLISKQIEGEWESSQTIPPPEFTPVEIGQDQVHLAWVPIPYSWDDGGYRLLGSLISGGPYQEVTTTADKLTTEVLVTGLDPATEYFFVLQTVTAPHANNANLVESAFSEQINVITVAADACILTCSATVPASAAQGESVPFSGSATGNSCDGQPSYQWDFGDGQNAAGTSANHSYGFSGTYTWQLVATLGAESCTANGSIAVSDPGTDCGDGVCEAGESAWTCSEDCGFEDQETGRVGASSVRAAVPAAVGGISGVGGTYWVSEAMLHNPSNQDATYTLYFTADDQPTQVLTAGPLTLGAGEAEFRSNFVEDVFGVTSNGSVRMESDQALMLVSRTFNDQPGGTYGQFLGAVDLSRALAVGDEAYLLGLSDDGSFRSNILLQEVGGVETKVTLTVFDADGDEVGDTEITVPALAKYQSRLASLGYQNLEDGYATVEPTSGGRVVAIASVVDEITGDAMTVDALHPSQIELVEEVAAKSNATASAKIAQGSVSFVWSPTNPVVNEAVQFTDTSTATVLGWSWSFGDGGTSNRKNPTHTYTAAGTYTVSLSAATSLFGNTFVTGTVTVGEEPDETPASHYLVAVVASAPGDQNTRWRSDVWILNPFDTSQLVVLTYVPVGTIGAHRQQVVVGPGEQRAIEDIVGQAFADAGTSKGALHIWAPVGVFVNSRTYNLGTSGTYGQAIPALGGGDLLTVGDTGRLLKLKSTTSARCNMGFTEMDGTASTIHVKLYTLNGTTPSLLAERDFNVGGYGHLQVNRVFGAMGLSDNYEEALATVQVSSGGSVYVYASNVDAATGDAEFITAIKE